MKNKKLQKLKAGFLLIFFLKCLIIFILTFSTCKNTKPATPPVLGITEEIYEEKETEIIVSIPVYKAVFLAAGDNLFHETIINSHIQNDGTHNFAPVYEEIKDIIQSADLAFINQETVMAGGSFGYSGYPEFNTPQSLAFTLAETGFDIINLANNHAMDMGRSGLYSTLDFLETINGLTVIGARKEGESHKILNKNNITLGFLAYTYGLNGILLPENNPNLVSVINKDKMSQEINALRPLCDFLIVSMHWGTEYALIEPDETQKDLAKFLAEQKVDLIIGHHPHVLQRFEKLPRPDGKETLCFYSIGNFVSNQNRKERILGALMLVTFVKKESGLYIEDPGLLPVICHIERGINGTKSYPLYKYTQELLEKHILWPRDNLMDFYFFDSVLNSLGVNIIRMQPAFSPVQASLPLKQEGFLSRF